MPGSGGCRGSKLRERRVSPSGSNLVQVGRIAMLKPEVRKAVLLRAPVSGFDEASRNVDAQYVSQSLAAGSAVVPSPQPRSRTLSDFEIPSAWTSASPLSLMLAAMRVKSPFSHSAWFGFTRRCSPSVGVWMREAE